MTDSNDERLTQLESRLAFQEATIAELEQALAGQQQQLLAQQRLIDAISQRLRDLAAGESASGDAPQDERPPHY